MDEAGAKALVAAVLKLAHEDYVSGRMDDAEESNKINTNAATARAFLHGQWCRDLCDMVEVDYEKFVEVTIQKSRLTAPVFKYLEAEIKDFHKTVAKIAETKKDIAEERQMETNKGGKSSSVGNPTEAKAIKIASDRQLQRMEAIVRAIREVYDSSDEQRKKLVRLKYWQHIYMDEGIMATLDIGRDTFYRWKREFVLKVALKLGYL
ncbi:MAG: hypothetical protein AB9917_02140 [Negativicutes bacterium]